MMETTEYPIVSADRTVLHDNTDWGIIRHIVDLGVCKLVTLKIQRKTNITIGTSYSTLLQLSSFPNTPIPTETQYVGFASQGLNIAFGSGGLSAQAKTSGNYQFNVIFTYVVI